MRHPPLNCDLLREDQWEAWPPPGTLQWHAPHLQFLQDVLGGSVLPLGNGDIWLLFQLGTVGGAALSFDF